MSDDQGQQPESLLPYEDWTEKSLRGVVAEAIEYASVHGLPGGHHFYLTFRTDHPGTVIPPRLRAQYPQEMTIVLQHQFWDLNMDRDARLISVGLSFGGISASLAIPLDAVVGFADPYVRYGLRFHAVTPEVVAELGRATAGTVGDAIRRRGAAGRQAVRTAGGQPGRIPPSAAGEGVTPAGHGAAMRARASREAGGGEPAGPRRLRAATSIGRTAKARLSGLRWPGLWCRQRPWHRTGRGQSSGGALIAFR